MIFLPWLVVWNLALSFLLALQVMPRRSDPSSSPSAGAIVLDLALFMDLAHRAGESGVQEWLSFYLKAPQSAGDNPAEQDLFIQQTKLKNTLREWMGERPVTHSEAG